MDNRCSTGGLHDHIELSYFEVSRAVRIIYNCISHIFGLVYSAIKLPEKTGAQGKFRAVHEAQLDRRSSVIECHRRGVARTTSKGLIHGNPGVIAHSAPNHAGVLIASVEIEFSTDLHCVAPIANR
jgi:hypothetical protein